MRRLHTYYLVVLVLGYIAFNRLNMDGALIPLRTSTSYNHPDSSQYKIIDFKDFEITLPDGWKDKGHKRVDDARMIGKLVKDDVEITYDYGQRSRDRVETLREFLFNHQVNLMIMGTEKIIGKTDSTISVTYDWPVDPAMADTIKTGILTDSIVNFFGEVKVPLQDPNYYALTAYNDSVYFIPIEVPSVIINSEITDFEKNGYTYQVVKPKSGKRGWTRLTVCREGFCIFSLHADKLDRVHQEILINAGRSIRFKEGANDEHL